MKFRLIFVSLSIFSIIFLYPRFSFAGLSVEQCRLKAKTLHVGVLRKDISADFKSDGGPSSRLRETLIVNGCREGDGRELRIDVVFEVSPTSLKKDSADSDNSTDKIKSISNSYLGYSKVK